jgi:hypothetical protein
VASVALASLAAAAAETAALPRRFEVVAVVVPALLGVSAAVAAATPLSCSARFALCALRFARAVKRLFPTS